MSLTPVQQSAYNDIRAKLDGSGWSNTVTHDEVNAVADRLEGLTAADANAVVAEMTRTGQLDRLASEGTDGSWFGNGGYTEGERRDMFNDLAGKLSGENLAAVSNAFESSQSGEEGYDLAGEFAAAVASHAPAMAKVNYIKALARETTDGSGLDGTSFGSGSWSRKVDGDAAAVGTVLGSLRGAQAQEAFAALQPDQLRAVMATGIDETDRYSRGGVIVSFDTGRFTGVMNAAASIPNADIKARVFDGAADQLRTIRETPSVSIGANSVGRSDALRSVTDPMAKLIDSDTMGVVRELAHNAETYDGSDLSAYTQQMFATGQEDRLAQQMGRLQFGNGLNEDPVARLNQTVSVNGETRYENAGTLGYFVGSAYAGAKAQSGDVQQQQEDVTSMLKSLLIVVDKASGPVAGGVVSVGGEWIGKAVQGAIDDPGSAPAQRLENASLPSRPVDPDNPYDLELAVGDGVSSGFGDRVDQVSRNAQP